MTCNRWMTRPGSSPEVCFFQVAGALSYQIGGWITSATSSSFFHSCPMGCRDLEFRSANLRGEGFGSPGLGIDPVMEPMEPFCEIPIPAQGGAASAVVTSSSSVVDRTRPTLISETSRGNRDAS